MIVEKEYILASYALLVWVNALEETSHRQNMNNFYIECVKVDCITRRNFRPTSIISRNNGEQKGVTKEWNFLLVKNDN